MRTLISAGCLFVFSSSFALAADSGCDAWKKANLQSGCQTWAQTKSGAPDSLKAISKSMEQACASLATYPSSLQSAGAAVGNARGANQMSVTGATSAADSSAQSSNQIYATINGSASAAREKLLGMKRDLQASAQSKDASLKSKAANCVKPVTASAQAAMDVLNAAVQQKQAAAAAIAGGSIATTTATSNATISTTSESIETGRTTNDSPDTLN